ncbi:hypothetical protein Tco_0291167 [Tanacetum coccineum]
MAKADVLSDVTNLLEKSRKSCAFSIGRLLKFGNGDAFLVVLKMNETWGTTAKADVRSNVTNLPEKITEKLCVFDRETAGIRLKSFFENGNGAFLKSVDQLCQKENKKMNPRCHLDDVGKPVESLGSVKSFDPSTHEYVFAYLNVPIRVGGSSMASAGRMREVLVIIQVLFHVAKVNFAARGGKLDRMGMITGQNSSNKHLLSIKLRCDKSPALFLAAGITPLLQLLIGFTIDPRMVLERIGSAR